MHLRGDAHAVGAQLAVLACQCNQQRNYVTFSLPSVSQLQLLPAQPGLQAPLLTPEVRLTGVQLVGGCTGTPSAWLVCCMRSARCPRRCPCLDRLHTHPLPSHPSFCALQQCIPV